MLSAKPAIVLCGRSHFRLFLCVMFLSGSIASHAAQNARSPEANFDPAQKFSFKEAHKIGSILMEPVEHIDLARTKFTIDNMIEPAIDIAANLKKSTR